MRWNILYTFKATIIAWFLFWGFLLVEMFYPPVVFKYNTLPLPISKSSVKPGEIISYHGDYCKYTAAPADVTHALEKETTEEEKRQGIADIKIIFEEIKKSNLPMGCHTIDPIVPIPTGTEPGKYRIVKVIHSEINNYRQVNMQFYSEWFNVL